MIIDMHAHLWLARIESDKADIRSVIDQYSLSKVMISTLKGYIPDEEEITLCNDATLGFMKEEPGVIEGYCYLNPRNPNTMDELKRRISQGMCGVKLWVATFCDDPVVNPVIEYCIDEKLPILVHAFHKSVGQLEFESLGINVANLAKRYPEAKLIMAHLGANCQRELKPVQDCPNVCADFSGSIHHCDDLAYAKKLLGAERLLFGSDMPGIDFATSYAQVREAALSEEEREMILYKNAQKLFERS